MPALPPPTAPAAVIAAPANPAADAAARRLLDEVAAYLARRSGAVQAMRPCRESCRAAVLNLSARLADAGADLVLASDHAEFLREQVR